MEAYRMMNHHIMIISLLVIMDKEPAIFLGVGFSSILSSIF